MINKSCKYCSSLFKTLNVRKDFCSKLCLNKNYYKKNKAYLLEKERIRLKQIKQDDPKKYEEILLKNRIRNKNYYKNNSNYKSNQIKKTQKRRKDNPDECAKVRRSYYLRVEKPKNSLLQNKIKRQEKWKKKYYSNKVFRVKEMMKSRLKRCLKQKKVYKPESFNKAFGCSYKNFKQYMEKKFKNGMSWDNHGKWHCDHIEPLSSFDLSKKSEYLRANHYTNFQPLWARENLKKSNKINYKRRANV